MRKRHKLTKSTFAAKYPTVWNYGQSRKLIETINNPIAEPLDLPKKSGTKPCEFEQRVNKLDADEWGWDMEAAKESRVSDVVRFDENCLGKDRLSTTVTFHPDYAIGTAAVWGTRALDAQRITYWEVRVNCCYGTSMMFGIGTRRSPTITHVNFVDLLGDDDELARSMRQLERRQSYGLAHTGLAFHGGKSARFCDPFPGNRECVVGLLFNGFDGTLAYSLDGKMLGVAFRDIDCTFKILYPMVSSTSQRSRFSLINQRISSRHPPSLRSFCEWKIVSELRDAERSAESLPVPKNVKTALTELQGKCQVEGWPREKLQICENRQTRKRKHVADEALVAHDSIVAELLGGNFLGDALSLMALWQHFTREEQRVWNQPEAAES